MHETRERHQILPVSINSRVSGWDWVRVTAWHSDSSPHVSTTQLPSPGPVSSGQLATPDQAWPATQPHTARQILGNDNIEKNFFDERALFFRNLFNNLFIVWQILRNLLFVPDIIFLLSILLLNISTYTLSSDGGCWSQVDRSLSSDAPLV